jgi:hypothetical protein
MKLILFFLAIAHAKIVDQIYLHPNVKPTSLTIEPYQIYDLLVPVNQVTSYNPFWFRTSWNGPEALSVSIKRKKINFDLQHAQTSEKVAERFDPYRKLLDHNYPLEF